MLANCKKLTFGHIFHAHFYCSKNSAALLQLVALSLIIIFLSLQYAAALVNAHPDQVPGGYSSVGSGAGIAGFLDGGVPGQNVPYAAATSDDPMTVAQDSKATQLYGGKLTFPIALTTYSFFTRKAQGIQISGRTLADVYTGRTSQWGSVKAGLSGTIVPICRNSPSGTTEVITSYLSYYDNSITISTAVMTSVYPFNQNGNLKSPPTSNYPSGSLGMAQAVIDNPNAIAYIQTGIGANAQIAEMYVGNPAGAYLAMTSTTADPYAAIPRQLPDPTSSWNGIFLTNANGKNTYPIVSFEYTFLRQHYNGAFNGAIPNLKAFFKFVLSNDGQSLGKQAYFLQIPDIVSKKAKQAIDAIST